MLSIQFLKKNFLQAAAVNHVRNDTTIEQDYTENFDLALTNDNLYSNGNEPTESAVCICFYHKCCFNTHFVQFESYLITLFHM